MLFLELWFWIFAAVAVPAYWICPRPLKLYWLLGASAVFHYHFAGPAGMTPIILLAIMTYGIGRGAAGASGRRLFAGALVVLVGALAFYKYSEFFLRSGLTVLGAAKIGVSDWIVTWRSPAIPLGISFFTFEFVHYLYEVRVHGRPPIRSPVHFALFAIFFPCLAAGPIKRFPDFVPQLDQLSNPRRELLWTGVRRVIHGLFKKVCIADLLVEVVAVLEALPRFNGPVVVTLAVAQGFRIYYDFSGYSDIAIGLAQTMNLRVPENFHRPYWSTSLQEFWRRWHISLSAWIRDYVYIPLGGNRTRRALNLLLAMFLCGLWHGANWNFALWGLYHGLGLAAEAGVRRVRPGLFAGGPLQKAAGWALCYSYVTYGWLVFFYPIGTVVELSKGLLRWE
jgi:alginate O-acetyltransferase complex protein AlgI